MEEAIVIPQYLIMLGGVVGIVFVCCYSIWEQRRQAAIRTERILSGLRGLGWKVEPLGQEIKSLEFGSFLPVEMMTSRLQKPFFYRAEPRAWLFGNEKTMHRRIDVFGNRVVMVIRIPHLCRGGARLQENIRYANTKRPLDSRFSQIEEVQRGGRSWWACATDSSPDSGWLKGILLRCEVPREIEAVQVLGGYFVCSSGLRFDRESNYTLVLRCSEELFSNFERLAFANNE